MCLFPVLVQTNKKIIRHIYPILVHIVVITELRAGPGLGRGGGGCVGQESQESSWGLILQVLLNWGGHRVQSGLCCLTGLQMISLKCHVFQWGGGFGVFGQECALESISCLGGNIT